jgi:hypothetical protein
MERENIHTKNQPKGSARNLSDTLDREGEAVAPGQRELADDAEKRDNRDGDRSPPEDLGAPGGTAGTGGTNHEQDR